MSIKSNLHYQWKQLRSLDRNAWLFLTVTVLTGIFFAGWNLYFNFYFLALGFSRSWLGIFSGMHPAATLIFALLMGVISDKIGPKAAMLIGTLGFLVGCIFTVTTSNPYFIMIALFLAGVLDALYIVNHLPVLSRLTTKENKSFLFSLNFGLSTFAGMLGNFLAGYMPSWLQTWFSLQVGSTENYRTVILFGIIMTIVAFTVPMLMIQIPDAAETEDENTETGNKESSWQSIKQVFAQPITWKLFTPNFLIGFGAALLVPFMNLFLVDKFGVSEWGLGILFSVAGFLTGVGSLLSPTLEKAFGSRIRAVVLAQGLSLIFLLVLGFGPALSLAVMGFLMRGALMNMGIPLWDSFSMDQVPEKQQARISSILFIAWQIGWAIAPSFSGIVQENFGFTPLFIATGLLYASAILVTWVFFGKADAPQLNPAMEAIGD